MIRFPQTCKNGHPEIIHGELSCPMCEMEANYENQLQDIEYWERNYDELDDDYEDLKREKEYLEDKLESLRSEMLD